MSNFSLFLCVQQRGKKVNWVGGQELIPGKGFPVAPPGEISRPLWFPPFPHLLLCPLISHHHYLTLLSNNRQLVFIFLSCFSLLNRSGLRVRLLNFKRCFNHVYGANFGRLRHWAKQMPEPNSVPALVKINEIRIKIKWKEIR